MGVTTKSASATLPSTSMSATSAAITFSIGAPADADHPPTRPVQNDQDERADPTGRLIRSLGYGAT